MNQRKRKTIINNIESINMEIDYDKLAEAIVKAQNMYKLDSESIFKARSSLAKIFNMIFYTLLGCLFLAFSVSILHNSLIDNVFSCIMVSVLMFLLFLVSIKSTFESSKDKEAEAYNHFNTNVSLVALIVALVALFKG